MSKLTEFLKLIPEGMKNLNKVSEGVWNQIQLGLDTLPEDERSEIMRRRMICAFCPHMSNNAKYDEHEPYVSERTDDHCIFCKCPIPTRTASLSANCGIESYNALNPDKPMPLSWKAYQKN